MKIIKRISADSLYRNLRAITEGNDTLSRIFLNACLQYAVRRDTLLKSMSSLVAPNSVVYDIGAHVGFYSSVLAKKIENSLIYSFEPNPQIYAVLVKNISVMKLKGKVIPKNIALSADRGTSTLYVSSYSARSSLYERYAKYDNNKVINTLEVDCYSIDYLVESGCCKPPDVMKIDVEGHEYEVLRGASNTIASKSPQIFVEPHGGEDGVPNKDRIKDFLTPFGYQFQDIWYHIWCYKETK